MLSISSLYAKVDQWVDVDQMNISRFYTDAPKTYLLSFPGSGNTWLRYCIEFLTKRPTLEMRTQKITKINCPIGYWLDMQTDYTKLPVWKVHYIDQMKSMGTFDPSNETLIVIVRNPKEALPRIFNLLSQRNKNKPLENPIAKELFNNSLTMNYFDILNLYDSWCPDKRHLIYYEDLITQPENVLRNLLHFLQDTPDYIDEFMLCYYEHKCTSLSMYEKQEDSSLTKGEKTKHHALLMSPEERQKLDQYIAYVFPDIWQKYLELPYADK